jgi:pyruvate dehydrogenase E2 component (dihydrolipoamide acetyltransferase)
MADATAHNAGLSPDLLQAIPLVGMRAAIARSMRDSLQDMAQLTLHRTVPVTNLLTFRNSFPSASRPTMNDLLLCAVAKALPRHPAVNATLEDSTIFRWRPVHLGMAVAVEAGLVVPVIRNADQLTVAALHDETHRLRRLARGSQIGMSDLVGGTFTVSNLGAFGIDWFTPIINPPQVAILGVGRIRAGVVQLSLTVDHRALDGAPAALFLEDLVGVFARPERHL